MKHRTPTLQSLPGGEEDDRGRDGRFSHIRLMLVGVQACHHRLNFLGGEEILCHELLNQGAIRFVSLRICPS